LHELLEVERQVEPMKTHPPLCPKAESVFETAGGLIGVWPASVGHLHESNPAQRVFIARYEACAWLDASVVWLSRSAMPGDVAGTEAAQCERNYHEWREWEVQP
jgi:hypothetical protein